MQLKVVNYATGKTVTYDVEPEQTVGSLREQIKTRQDVPTWSSLLFTGKPLNDDQTLNHVSDVIMVYASNEAEPMEYDPARKPHDEPCTLEIVGGTRVDAERGLYWELAHGSKYKVRLFNAFYVKCEFALEIDGHRMGNWLVPPRTSVDLERSLRVAKQFTFLREKYAVENGGLAPRGTGIEANREQNGLVKATFTPHDLDSNHLEFESAELAERALEHLFAKHEYQGLNYKTFPRGIPDGALLTCSYPEPEEDCDEDAGCGLFDEGHTGSCDSANWARGATAFQERSAQTFGLVDRVPTDSSRRQVCMLRLVARKDEVINAAALDLSQCEPLKSASYPVAVDDA